MEHLDFQKFIDWALLALVSGTMAWCAKILTAMSTNISELNTKVALIIERTTWHEKEIERHESRISNLEWEKQNAYPER